MNEWIDGWMNAKRDTRRHIERYFDKQRLAADKHKIDRHIQRK